MDEIIFRPSPGQLSGYYYHDGWIRTHFWRCERWSCLVALPETLATLIKLWTIMWRAIFFSHSLIEAFVECFEKKVHSYSTVHHATLRQYVLIRNVPAICRWFWAFFFGRIFIFSSCTVFTCRCSLLVHVFIFFCRYFLRLFECLFSRIFIVVENFCPEITSGIHHRRHHRHWTSLAYWMQFGNISIL